jgi:hypothetical protein
MAVSVPVCRSTLSMQWGHNAAALGLPPVRGAQVVSESPPRYDYLHEGAATGQSHPRRAPPHRGPALWSPRPLPQQKEELMVQQIREDETLCLLCR